MSSINNTRGSSALELLCAILFTAALGGLAVSVLLTASRRVAEIAERDLQRRSSERVFGTIADAVRAQREAPGLPLWSLLEDRRALDPWPRSIPRAGIRAPLPQQPLLAFARVEAGAQWRIIRERVGTDFNALPLCRSPLFQSAPSTPPSEGHFLGVAAEQLILLHGRVSLRQLRSTRCYGQTAQGEVKESDTLWPFHLRGGATTPSDRREARDLIALRPITEGFLLYLDNGQTVRRAALLTTENQPVASGVKAFRPTVNQLPMIAEEELVVRLEYEGHEKTEPFCERWILPVATIGEQLLGIL